MLPLDTRKDTHLKIGRLLRKTMENDDIDSMAFMILSHYNESRDLVTDKEELAYIADLNRIASEKTRRSMAYETAKVFCQIGLDILNTIGMDFAWTNHYKTTFSLHKTMATSTSFMGDYAVSEIFCKSCIEHANNADDKSYAVMLYANMCHAQLKVAELLALSKGELKDMGILIPEQDQMNHNIESELVELKKKIERGNIEEIYHSLPILTTAAENNVFHHLSYVQTTGSNLNNWEMAYWAAMKAANLTLQRGISFRGATIFAFLSAPLCWKKCWKLAGIARELSIKFLKHTPMDFKARILVELVYYCPFALTTLELEFKISEGYRVASDGGVISVKMFALFSTLPAHMVHSKSLADGRELDLRFRSVAEQFRGFVLDQWNYFAKCIEHFAKGPEEAPLPEPTTLAIMQQIPTPYIVASAYIYGNKQERRHASAYIDRDNYAFNGCLFDIWNQFFMALIHLDEYEGQTSEEQAKTMLAINTHQEKIAGMVELSKDQFRCLWLIVEAEKVKKNNAFEI